jgi:hypothetical protein
LNAQESRVALNILTGSTLVVKRIASKESKNPRGPVDGDALVAEVRFPVFRSRPTADVSRLAFFLSVSKSRNSSALRPLASFLGRA